MNENQPSSGYSVIEWLDSELYILRPGIGSQRYHIEFFFLLQFATVVEETYTFMEI